MLFLRSKLLIAKFFTIVGLVWAVLLYLSYNCPSEEPESAVELHPSPNFLVPNIVHFIHFGSTPLTYIDAVCMLAALKNQKPDKLYVHSDEKKFDGGKYWQVVESHKSARGVIEVKYRPVGFLDDVPKRDPDRFIEKLKVLMTYGGIYLDHDTYIVRKLDHYRRFPVTVGHSPDSIIPDSIILASKDAKFLQAWLQNYTSRGISSFSHKQRTVETLRQAHVKTMKDWLGDSKKVIDEIYLDSSAVWKSYTAIHLCIDLQYLIPRNLSHVAKYPVVFNETNILRYETDLREMALDVYPNNEYSSRRKIKRTRPRIAATLFINTI